MLAGRYSWLAIMSTTRVRCSVCWWLSPVSDARQSDNILSAGGTAWIPSRRTDIPLKSVSVWLTHLGGEKHWACIFFAERTADACHSDWPHLQKKSPPFASSVFLEIINKREVCISALACTDDRAPTLHATPDKRSLSLVPPYIQSNTPASDA